MRATIRPVADGLIGTTVDNGEYRIVQRIGSGGMGSVYKAEQPSMNRMVAIKVLHAKFADRDDLNSRFRREARTMSQLSHPNTARVYKYGTLPDGSAYFVMDFLKGRNLAHVVRQEGPMAPERAINIMIQVCGALDEAHQAGIIHRDLKPENIFLTQPIGGEDFPKVLDFGLAKVGQKQMGRGSMMLTKQGMVFGTPEFMSPEQTQGEKLDRRSDVYSLGLILYELLTGKLPFDATKPVEVMRAHVKDPPIPLSRRVPGIGFSERLDTVMLKALAKRPRDRYQTAMEFADALQHCLMGAPTAATQRALRAVPTPVPPAAAGADVSEAGLPTEPEASWAEATSPWPMLLIGIGLGLVVAIAGIWVLR